MCHCNIRTRSILSQSNNQGGHYAAEDIVNGAFTFASGVHGVGTWCFTAFRREDANEIVGSAGAIRFSTFGTEPIVLETEAGVRTFPIDNPAHVQQPLIQTVVDELTGVGTCPSTGESAARTSWVLDEMLREYRSATRTAQ